jgi:hypothetical protein
MGEARRRGNREQRVVDAAPRPPRMGAEERRRVMADAMAHGLAKGLTEVLTPIFGKLQDGKTTH